jgi:serine/threonine protein kinase
MDHADRERLKDIFTQAIELDGFDRLTYIHDACGDDPELQFELLSLLKAHDSAVNIIDENVVDIATHIGSSEPDLTQKKFGNYRIIREIGHGGMGTVFLAERDDGEFDQNVALKIVRQSIADSHMIERFRQERQILAGLSHPNIAMLLDGGITELGEPFIAMEFVEGLPLNDYAASKRLNVDDKLRVFLKVCSAVAFAHRNLVVHRDIKPSNIFVTADGEPKLLDFGLAKAFENDAGATQTAMRAFTPAYASPEQISGKKITTSSDVYSLGVVLYELLTGSKPLEVDNKSFEEIVLTVTSTRPIPPSAVENGEPSLGSANQFKGDLDNIALTALRKEPERRYGSVDDFAQDIRNYLDGRPVSARPNTFAYRTSKFVRRNKIAVVAACLVILFLTAGVAVSVWQANVARRERDRAQKRFQDVRKLSNSLLFDITPKIENLPGATEAREAIVSRALEYLDSLASESSNDNSLREELAAAYEKVGDLQGNPNKPNLNNYSGAVESYTKALALRRSLPETSEDQRAIAKNLQSTSLIRNRQNDISGSIADAESAIAIYDRLIAETAADPELRLERISAIMDQGQIYSRNNQYGIAVPLFRDTINELSGSDQGTVPVKILLARASAFLSNALSWNGQQADAESEMSKAVAIVDDLKFRSPEDPSTRVLAFTVYSLASSIYEEADTEKALYFAERSLDAAKGSVSADKADMQARYDLAKAYSREGLMLGLRGRSVEASEMFSNSEEIYNSLVSEDPKNDGYRRNLGNLYVRMGDTSELRGNIPDAMLKYQNSAVIFQRLSDADPRDTLARRDLAQSLKSVGMMAIKLGDHQAARRSLQEALDLLNDLKLNNSLGKFDEIMVANVEAALRGI